MDRKRRTPHRTDIVPMSRSVCVLNSRIISTICPVSCSSRFSCWSNISSSVVRSDARDVISEIRTLKWYCGGKDVLLGSLPALTTKFILNRWKIQVSRRNFASRLDPGRVKRSVEYYSHTCAHAINYTDNERDHTEDSIDSGRARLPKFWLSHCEVRRKNPA